MGSARATTAATRGQRSLPGIAAAPRDPERHAEELSPLLCAWFAANRRDLPWRVRYSPDEDW